MSRILSCVIVCITMAWSLHSFSQGLPGPALSAQAAPPGMPGAPSAPAARAVNRGAQTAAGQAGHDDGHADHGGAGGHGHGGMGHPGLPLPWISHAAIAILAIAIWFLFAPSSDTRSRSLNLASQPVIGPVVRFLTSSPYPLLAIRIVSVAAFVLVIAAGLFGSPYAERNFATVLVWNLWWPLVIVSVFFVGTAWCAVCPWNALANWIVRLRLWRREDPHPGFNLKVPPYMRNTWLALVMFMGLTWLQLGVNVTSIPFATALMASEMLFLSLLFLLVFERKAFCRYACPVGRTLGCYSRVAPVAVRPVEQATCDSCKTLECYNGSAQIDPCPTNLTIGRFSQNTYCLSCGNCVLSCPYKNVTWRLRPMGSEARDQTASQVDETWFMLALLGITSFHGLTMLPLWGDWVSAVAGAIGESGRPFFSFTLAMMAAFAAPALLYACAIGLLVLVMPRGASYRRQFCAYPFIAVPLAFTYHLAHNLDHMLREGGEILAVFADPFGTGLEPLSAAERHQQSLSAPIADEWLFTLQAALMVLGFFLALQIARQRGAKVNGGATGATGLRALPILAFVLVIVGMNFWLMAQGMNMRM